MDANVTDQSDVITATSEPLVTHLTHDGSRHNSSTDDRSLSTVDAVELRHGGTNNDVTHPHEDTEDVGAVHTSGEMLQLKSVSESHETVTATSEIDVINSSDHMTTDGNATHCV